MAQLTGGWSGVFIILAYIHIYKQHTETTYSFLCLYKLHVYNTVQFLLCGHCVVWSPRPSFPRLGVLATVESFTGNVHWPKGPTLPKVTPPSWEHPSTVGWGMDVSRKTGLSYLNTGPSQPQTSPWN